MAPAAELIYAEPVPLEDVLPAEAWTPLVFAVPELESDQMSRERAARFIGAVALQEATMSVEATPPARYSLMDALHEAAAGNETARKLIETNVQTDVVERTIKSGHVTSVTLETNAQGQIVQHGQTAESIQENSLLFASGNGPMRHRTEAETCNMFRIGEAQRTGLLEDYAFVVFSRAPDDMTLEEMQDIGFFTDTLSCAIQVTSNNNGVITTESAFVAGKRHASAERHDDETIRKVGEVLGVDLSGTATEVLATPLLIHKDLLPQGVLSLVEVYDECADGTFFGEEKPRQDYLTYRSRCQEREAGFEPKAQAITEELIAQATTVQTPLQATELLNDVSAKHMIEQAITDDSIDVRVFGVPAAVRIEQGRYYYDIGDHERAASAVRAAVRVETSSSCPTASRLGSTSAGSAEGSDGTGGDSKLEDCDFVSKKCPVCGDENAKTRVRNGVYYHVGKSCKA